eukprot:4969001-Prymnesium_polylepis.1
MAVAHAVMAEKLEEERCARILAEAEAAAAHQAKRQELDEHTQTRIKMERVLAEIAAEHDEAVRVLHASHRRAHADQEAQQEQQLEAAKSELTSRISALLTRQEEAAQAKKQESVWFFEELIRTEELYLCLLVLARA